MIKGEQDTGNDVSAFTLDAICLHTHLHTYIGTFTCTGTTRGDMIGVLNALIRSWTSHTPGNTECHIPRTVRATCCTAVLTYHALIWSSLLDQLSTGHNSLRLVCVRLLSLPYIEAFFE